MCNLWVRVRGSGSVLKPISLIKRWSLSGLDASKTLGKRSVIYYEAALVPATWRLLDRGTIYDSLLNMFLVIILLITGWIEAPFYVLHGLVVVRYTDCCDTDAVQQPKRACVMLSA